MAKETTGSNEPLVVNIHIDSAAYEPPTVQAQRKTGGPEIPQNCLCSCGSTSGAGGGSGPPRVIQAE